MDGMFLNKRPTLMYLAALEKKKKNTVPTVKPGVGQNIASTSFSPTTQYAICLFEHRFSVSFSFIFPSTLFKENDASRRALYI